MWAMIGDKRDPDVTYRLLVANDSPDYYDVTVYPQKGDNDESKKVKSSTYRTDLLPEWMHDTMKVLDVAGSDVDVWTVGLRSDLPNGRVYWFSSKQHEELLRNAEGTTQGTCPP